MYWCVYCIIAYLRVHVYTTDVFRNFFLLRTYYNTFIIIITQIISLNILVQILLIYTVNQCWCYGYPLNKRTEHQLKKKLSAANTPSICNTRTMLKGLDYGESVARREDITHCIVMGRFKKGILVLKWCTLPYNKI